MGDNFETCSFNCAPIKKGNAEELSSVVHKLDAHSVLSIPSKIISEVADWLEAWNNVDWIGRILGEVDKKYENNVFYYIDCIHQYT